MSLGLMRGLGPGREEIAADAEHVALLESAIRAICARYEAHDVSDGQRAAFSEACNEARAKRRNRVQGDPLRPATIPHDGR
jgi:hypothetical protein